MNRVITIYNVGNYGNGAIKSLQAFGMQENHQFKIAEEVIMKSLNIEHDNMIGYLSLANLKYNMGNIREGQRIAREFQDIWCKSNKINESLLFMGKNMIEYGQTPQAMNVYESLLDEKPTLINVVCRTVILLYLDIDHYATLEKWNEYCLPRFQKLLEDWEKYKHQRNYPFYDVMYSVVLSKTKNFDLLEDFKKEIINYCNNDNNNNIIKDDNNSIKISCSDEMNIYNNNVIDYINKMKYIGLPLIDSIELYYKVFYYIFRKNI